MRTSIVALTASVLLLASQAGADTSRTKSQTTALTFKAGVLGTTNFDWPYPSEESASPTFGMFGLSLEAHRLYRFVVGAGFDGALQLRPRAGSIPYYGPSTERLFTYQLYGSLGAYIWQNQTGNSAVWASVDRGKIWVNEFVSGDGFSSDRTFTGMATRLRLSWIKGLSGNLGFGVDAGWQWAEPSMQNYGFGTSRTEPPRLNLSGPVIAARLSLVGPLGRGTCQE